MNCPFCAKSTSVIDSRLIQKGNNIRRRRKCSECHFRFSTVEELRLLDLIVVKRDGHREPYRREKIEEGLQIALRKRSYTSEQFAELVRNIELDIHSTKQPEITSHELGQIVMCQLKGFDTVAYIRFASVYRQFEDVQTFQDELNALQTHNV